MFRVRLANLHEEGEISDADLKSIQRFTSLNSQPALTSYLYAKLGKLPHLANDADFQATERVMEKLGLSQITVNKKTAQPYEEQFWEQYDVLQDLTEEEMRKELPVFITDPSNQAKVEALLADRRTSIDAEETHRLAA